MKRWIFGIACFAALGVVGLFFPGFSRGSEPAPEATKIIEISCPWCHGGGVFSFTGTDGREESQRCEVCQGGKVRRIELLRVMPHPSYVRTGCGCVDDCGPGCDCGCTSLVRRELGGSNQAQGGAWAGNPGPSVAVPIAAKSAPLATVCGPNDCGTAPRIAQVQRSPVQAADSPTGNCGQQRRQGPLRRLLQRFRRR